MRVLILSVFAICCCVTECNVERAKTAERYCNTPHECHGNECCVSIIQPIGRRALQFGGHSGRCIAFGADGSGCLVRYGNFTINPTTMTLSCPCEPGLYCKGTDFFEVPQGEHGICTRS